jgi:2-polyprenyl-3-methyl-5-hydroxy-6-metoxy-1,4-benzoquinol methylase
MRLESVPQCPVCGDARRQLEKSDVRDGAFGAAPGVWSLQRCLGCRALYLNPRPDAASIHLAYRDYYTHTAGPAALSSRIKLALTNGYRNRVFATNFRPAAVAGSIVMPFFPTRAAAIRREDRGIGRAGGGGKRLLDVGCGNGRFLSLARKLEWECHGVEPDAAAAQVAREQGISLLGSRVEELPADLAGTFDVITLNQVIEHVYDPVDVLRHCHDLLRPGGYIWLETPNTDSMGYEIYGAHWRGLESPRHLVLFNFGSLSWSLERAGFERVQRLQPPDVTAHLFTLSAAMQLGRIAEKDTRALPADVRASTRAMIRKARAVGLRDPARAEFLSVLAYRPM